MKKIFIISTILLFSGFHSLAQEGLVTLQDTLRYYKATAKPIEAFNTKAVDYAPSISADGKIMIIESNKEGRYKLYESKLVNGQWSKPEGIPEINNYGDSTDLIGGPSLSFDGNYLFFFASFREGLGSEDIYFSERKGNQWSAPKNIGKPINSTGYEGFPSISSDGNTLYFVRQNFTGPSDPDLVKIWGTSACYSIYGSRKNPVTKEWGEPFKLPFPINQDCEKAPRILSDDRTLIFASNRLGGYGDYDLYQTYLNDIGDWTQPISLEFVNTASSDQFASISAQGDKMYYVQDSKDIYSVEIPPHLRQFKNNVIQGFITNGATGTGVEAEIIVRDAFTSKEIMIMKNNPNDGRYTVVLAVGNNYNIEVRKEGFTSRSFFFDLSRENEYKELDQDILLYSSAKLNLNLYDIDIFEPISATIKVKAQGATAFLINTENDATGKITLDMPLGKIYEVFIDKENFESQFFIFDVAGLVVYPDFERDVEMTPIKRQVAINIADLTNDGKIKSKVRIRNQNRDEVIIVEGNETVALRVGDRYEIEATSDQGYAFNSTIIEITTEGEKVVAADGNVIEGEGLKVGIELKLQPLNLGSNLTLRDILFKSGSDQLDDISFAELSRVILLMQENPTLSIEIAAHTDDVGSDAYNKILSERRAKSVASILSEEKIDPTRFVALGKGESEPIVPNDTEENRAKNRRVVLKILGI